MTRARVGGWRLPPLVLRGNEKQGNGTRADRVQWGWCCERAPAGPIEQTIGYERTTTEPINRIKVVPRRERVYVFSSLKKKKKHASTKRRRPRHDERFFSSCAAVSSPVRRHADRERCTDLPHRLCVCICGTRASE